MGKHQLGYSEFLGWALAGDLNHFYQDLRWENWQTDVEKLQGHQVLDLQVKSPFRLNATTKANLPLKIWDIRWLKCL